MLGTDFLLSHSWQGRLPPRTDHLHRACPSLCSLGLCYSLCPTYQPYFGCRLDPFAAITDNASAVSVNLGVHLFGVANFTDDLWRTTRTDPEKLSADDGHCRTSWSNCLCARLSIVSTRGSNRSRDEIDHPRGLCSFGAHVGKLGNARHILLWNQDWSRRWRGRRLFGRG